MEMAPHVGTEEETEYFSGVIQGKNTNVCCAVHGGVSPDGPDFFSGIAAKASASHSSTATPANRSCALLAF